jgi:hypothetical protein
MSIDDMFLRDPRVRALASEFGWNKYEARGRLLDVFAVVYDRVDAGGDGVLTPSEVDGAAEFDGLANAMVKHNLAVATRGGVRIKGSEERTKYLATRESSGRAGGVKSGESRRNKSKVTAKVTFAKTEGPLNPSVPDVVPDDPVADPVAVVPDPGPSPRKPRRERAYRLGPEWSPTGDHREQASELRVDLEREASRFRDHHAAKGSTFVDWNAAFRNWLRNAGEFQSGRRPAQSGFAAVLDIANGRSP